MKATSQRRTQRQRSETSTKALLNAARESFGRNGFAGTSAEGLAKTAGLTSGALYHHYRDKRDLFRAVFHELERTLAERVAKSAMKGRDPWDRLERGIAEYLRACAEPEFRQIVLLDGPSVLGLEEWRVADEQYHLRPLAATLTSAMRAGQIERRPALPLARVLLGLLTEAGLSAGDDRARVAGAGLWVLRRMRATGSRGGA